MREYQQKYKHYNYVVYKGESQSGKRKAWFAQYGQDTIGAGLTKKAAINEAEYSLKCWEKNKTPF